ncbi:retinol-binding protein pinta-like [Daphnia pulex]|uniref:retinol-binding protein pinta-like n=1 Tax=Daphnia pulex TaxID=6669 RepID=UPI001EDF13E7|nr:retinol-binding protein pinta-like [Daphnia pulex]
MSTKAFQTQLSQVILKRAQSELGEDEDRRQQVIAIVKKWMTQQPHLQRIRLDEYSIICFARGCKYSLEKIKIKIDLQCTLRTALPEFFTGWDPMKPRIQDALACGSFLPLLDYDQHDRKVIIMRPGCFDPMLFKAEDIDKANFMISDTMGREDEQMFVTGMVIIVDVQGFSLNHLTQKPLALFKKQMYFLQSAPISPKTINFIRTNSVFHSAYNMVTNMLNDKMKQRLKVHGSDFRSLYKEIDRRILPKDYGGDGLSLAKLTDLWKQKVEEQRDSLMESERNLRVDESRRPGKAKTAQDIFGIEGSFRKLNID